MAEVAPELLAAQALTDEAIEALVAERTAAKKARNCRGPIRFAMNWRRRAW